MTATCLTHQRSWYFCIAYLVCVQVYISVYIWLSPSGVFSGWTEVEISLKAKTYLTFYLINFTEIIEVCCHMTPVCISDLALAHMTL